MNTEIKDVMGSVRNWWAYEFLGALFILMSVLVFSFPLSSYAGLVIYFAVSIVLSGIMRITFALTNKSSLEHWGWYLTGGILDLLIGTFLLIRLDISALALPFYVGFFLMAGGIAAIAKSMDLREEGVKGNGWMLFSGIITIVLSSLIIFNPIIGMITVTLATSMGFAMLGIFYIILGFHLKKIKSNGSHFFGEYRTE